MRPLHFISTVLPSSTRSFNKRNSFNSPPNRNIPCPLSYGLCYWVLSLPPNSAASPVLCPGYPEGGLCLSSSFAQLHSWDIPFWWSCGLWRTCGGRGWLNQHLLCTETIIFLKQTNLNYTGKEGSFLNSSTQRDPPYKGYDNLLEVLQP